MTNLIQTRTLGEQINDLIEKEQWKKARALIEQALVEEPNSHWLLTRLGETFYEEKEYKRALEILLRARDIVPDCPLTLWHLAGTLDALGAHKDAMKLLTWILESKNTSDDDPCWESKQWTELLKTDCVFAIGVSLRNLGREEKAAHCFRQYIQMLTSGMEGSYPIEEALRHIRLLPDANPQQREHVLQKATAVVRKETGEKSSKLPQLNRKLLQQLQVA